MTNRVSLEQRMAAQAGGAITGAGAGAAGQGTAGVGSSTPASLLDGDGSAVVIHSGVDDYQDQDSAGARIACGVARAP